MGGCFTHLCIVPYRETFAAAAALIWLYSDPGQLCKTNQKQMEWEDGKNKFQDSFADLHFLLNV